MRRHRSSADGYGDGVCERPETGEANVSSMELCEILSVDSVTRLLRLDRRALLVST